MFRSKKALLAATEVPKLEQDQKEKASPLSTTSKTLPLSSTTSVVSPHSFTASKSTPMSTQLEKSTDFATPHILPQKMTLPKPFREWKPPENATTRTSMQNESANVPSKPVPTPQPHKSRLPSLAEKYGGFPSTRTWVPQKSTQSSSCGLKPMMTSSKSSLESTQFKEWQPPNLSFTSTLPQNPKPFGTVSSPQVVPSSSMRRFAVSTSEHASSMRATSERSASMLAASERSASVLDAAFERATPELAASKRATPEHAASERAPIEHAASEQVVDDSTLNGHEEQPSSASEQSIDYSIQQSKCTKKRKSKLISKQSKKKGVKSSKDSKENEGWPEDVEFDPKEKVMTIDENGKRGAVGGSIQARDIDHETKKKFIVEFNEHNQPLRKGGSILVRFLGRVAKNERFCPIGKVSWHKVSKQLKADIIQLVRSKFVLPNKKVIDKKALGRVAKTWRNYKYTLKKTHFNLEKRTKQEIYDDVPNGHASSQWIDLVDYWCSKQFEKLSRSGKEARGSLSHLHTTGSTSFADIRANYEKENGKKLSYIAYYDLTHKTEDGGFVDGTISEEFLAVAKSKADERAASSSKPRVQIENEVFNELMYDENSKRSIGFGYGVNKSAILGVHGELSDRGFHYTDDEDHIQVDNMKAELEAVTKRSQALEEKNQALEEKNQALEKRNQELGTKVQGHDEILKQLLVSVRDGHLSDEFFNNAKSFLCRSSSEVDGVSSGNGTRNGSGTS